MPRLIALLFALLLPACGSTVLDAEDYDASCDVPEDCVGYLVGDICACSCDYAPLSTDGAEQAAVDRAAIDCTQQPGGALSCAPCEDGPEITCSAEGRCEIVN